MIILGTIRYILISAVIVISMFLGLRMIFAHDLRREAWRSFSKRYVYVGRERFKRVTFLTGWLILLLSLWTIYNEIDRLISNL